jgi:outer membrane protein assembly factor BamB
VEVDIVVLANDDILETDTLSVSQGTYTPSWTWYVWYGDEPGEFEVTVNGFVAVNSPVVFYDPSDPGDPGDPDFDGIVEIVNTSYSTGRFPGEQVFVYAFVRETTGEDTGQISVDFSVEGEFISSQTVEVDAGETLQVTFSNFFEEPGTYQATLNDEEFEIVVETPQIDVELDNFRVSSSEVYSGQFVRVSVDAENIDDTAGEFEVEFKMYDLIGGPLSDGPVEIRAEAISGYLKPSESGTLDFHYHFEFAGEFHVEIEDFTPIEITVTNGWPQYGHGHGNRKSGALDAPMFNMDTLWSYAAGDESFHYVRSSPVVVDGVVYVGSWPPALHAVDAETGELVWDEPFATSSAVVNAPAVAGGRVFVTTGGAGGADLHAVDAETGNEIWTTEGLGDVHLTAPIVVDGIVYVGSDDGYLHAVDVADGDILWSYDAEAEIHSTPAYANGIVYFGSDGSVHAIDALSGTLAWEEPYNSVFVRSATTVVQLFSTGEWVVLVGTLNGEVHAIDADSGEAYWAEPFEVDGNIHASPVEAGQDVYVATDTGFVYQIDGLTGEASGWDSAFEADGGIVGSPFYANSRIHFGTIEGTFYAVPGFVAEPQPVWTYSIGSPLRSSPAVWDEVIYIGADDAKLYALYSLGEDHVPGVPPAIVEQPQSIIAEHLATVSFRVVAGGDEPLNYQWMFEEDPLDGAESNMLVLTDISMSNVGEYSVVVSNEVGSETSEAVRLDIQSSFTMDAELPDTVMVDEAADISVDLSADVQGSVGYPEVSYAIGISGPGPVNVEWEGESTSLGDGIDKWFSDTLFAVGAEFSESSNWALTFMSEGSYEITFAAYSVETQRDPVEEQIASVTKTVSVNDWMAPLITENPQSQTVDHGDSIHFNVIADGDGDLQYRWYKDSEPITDLVDSHQYTISSATSASEGIYSVEVVSPYGTAFSSNATLVVMLPESLPETLGDAEQESENFYQSSWLGRFFTGDASGGWINHESLGWFFVYSGATQGSVWLWDPVSNSNFYTDQTLYTFFYSDTYGWVYYHSDVSSSSGSRWFQRADDSEVINLETLPGPFQE